MAKNKSLINAKSAKKDDFYTQMTTIDKELYYYGIIHRQFEDKTIVLPCDEGPHSLFYQHFMLKRETYGWKKLIAIGYELKREAVVHVCERIDNGEFTEYKESIWHEKNEPVKGNGDFRGAATMKYILEGDIIVTNPPFSLLREFLTLLIDNNKHFLVLGNQNSISCKEIFPMFKEDKMWCGYTFNSVEPFEVRGDEYKYDHIEQELVNGKLKDKKIAYVSGITWFTNLPTTKRDEVIATGRSYNQGLSKGLYKKYDNYDAIEVGKVEHIPMDYKGVMGVPITFINKYNPKQFKLIGIDRYVEDNPNYGKRFTIDGKEKYARLLIQFRD